jgi:hypothetical protein
VFPVYEFLADLSLDLEEVGIDFWLLIRWTESVDLLTELVFFNFVMGYGLLKSWI